MKHHFHPCPIYPMKLTNCYRYMAVLYTASCGTASPLYGPLETGLQESQLLNSLKTCKSLEGPETDAYLSRTGLNGAYKTKKPIGGLFFSLHFEYGKDGGLKAVSFYSTTKAGKEEYDTRLKSLYKRMLNGLTGLYGPPMNLPDWIEKESLPAERVLYMHMWRLQPGCFLMAGLANMGASGYIPVFRISPPSGMPPKSRKDRNKLKSEWAAIPEFYEFIKAERFLANAVFAMSHKKYPDALQLFQKAADLGSPNGYWGLAHLYRLGPDGVEKNMRLADEYTRKSALSGFARAAMKFGKTWDQFCKSQDFTEAEDREWQNRNLRAARAGYASEQYNMGIICLYGFGVEKNLETAREWLEKAASQDHAQAKAALKALPDAGTGKDTPS